MRLALVAILVVLAALPTVAAARPELAQCGNAYTEAETAGPGGTYGTSANCMADETPVDELRVPERTVVGGDNPDAPAPFRDTATFEGEREP